MTSHTDNDIVVQIASSREAVESLRSFWTSKSHHPNADIDFYQNVIQSACYIERPHVMVFLRDERPVMLVAGRVEEHTVFCRFGYKTLFSTKARALTIIYSGILGEPNETEYLALVEELEAVLRRKDADLVFLSNLRVDSPLYRIATTHPRLICRDHLSVAIQHWRMRVPDSLSEFLDSRSSKHRYWLRRLPKVLERDYPEAVNIRVFTKESEIAQFCTDAEEIAQTTYHRGLGVGFYDSLTTRDTMKLFAQRGWLRGYILYLKNVPAAFWIGQKYGEVFHLLYTGYKPACRKYELGTILFLRMLEDLCGEESIRYLDFGFGDAPYKNRYADESWLEGSVYIFPGSLKGIALNLARTLSALVYRASVSILRRMGVLEKVKRIWRGRLVSQGEGVSSEKHTQE